MDSLKILLNRDNFGGREGVSSKVDTVQSLDSQDDVMGISRPHPHRS